MVELLQKEISFKHILIVYCWIFSKFFVKYVIPLFTNGNFIEGYISTTPIDAILTSSPFQLNSSRYTFTNDDWTCLILIYLILYVSSFFSAKLTHFTKGSWDICCWYYQSSWKYTLISTFYSPWSTVWLL